MKHKEVLYIITRRKDCFDAVRRELCYYGYNNKYNFAYINCYDGDLRGRGLRNINILLYDVNIDDLGRYIVFKLFQFVIDITVYTFQNKKLYIKKLSCKLKTYSD